MTRKIARSLTLVAMIVTPFAANAATTAHAASGPLLGWLIGWLS